MSDDLIVRTQVVSRLPRLPLLSNAINREAEFLLEIPPLLLSSIERKPKTLTPLCYVWKFESFPPVISLYYKPQSSRDLTI